MLADLERKLLLKEIVTFSHAIVQDGEGYSLFTEDEIKSLENEELEGLRALRNRLDHMCRSLGGAKR